MKHFCILALFTFMVSEAFSQSFRVVRTDKDQYFQRPDKLVYAIHIDSANTKSPTETLYYNYKYDYYPYQLTLDDICKKLKYDSWLGKYVIAKTDGSYTLFNHADLPILIHTDGKHAPWKLADLNTNAWVQATFNRKAGNDSTLIIDLEVISSDLKYLSHPINKTQIIIGKEKGLLKAFDFYAFPENYYPLEQIGSTNPDEGYVSYHANDVYDFNVGDVFQRKQEQRAGNSHAYYRIYTFNELIIKEKNGLDYMATERTCIVNVSTVRGSTTYKWSDSTKTIELSYPPDYFLELPFKRITDIVPGRVHINELYVNPAFENLVKEERYYYCSPNKWTPKKSLFTKGMGLISDYYYANEVLYYTDLMYCRKGTVTWGDSADFTEVRKNIMGIPTTGAANYGYMPVTVYPNPVSDKLYINTEDKSGSYIIYNPIGQAVMKGHFHGQESIPVAELPYGLYYIHLQGNQGKAIKSFMKH